MANFNKVVLVGRLTRDVETRSFANGGMVSKFGFAVGNRKKNSQTGNWEDVPMFIDCEAYNRGETGKLADTIRDYCRKGSQILIEGYLELDTWQDKTTGANRSKHKVVVTQMQLLDPKPQSGAGGPVQQRSNAGSSYNSGESAPQQYDGPPDDHMGGGGGEAPKNEDIPF